MYHGPGSALTSELCAEEEQSWNPQRNRQQCSSRGRYLDQHLVRVQSSLNPAAFRVVDHFSSHVASRNCSTGVYSSSPKRRERSECSLPLSPDWRTWKLNTCPKLSHPHPVSYSETPSKLTTLRYIFSPRLPPVLRLPVCSSSMSKRHPNVKPLTKVPHTCCTTASPTRLEESSSCQSFRFSYTHIHSIRNSHPFSPLE